MSRSWINESAWGIWLCLCIHGACACADELGLERKLTLLIKAYPETLARVEGGMLVFKDGGPALGIDDGRAKSHAEKLANADIEDSLSQIYPAGGCDPVPTLDFDPGRIRAEALMKRLYGATPGAVEAHLTTINWFGRSLRVTTRQGVAEALTQVRDEIAAHPELVPYATNSAGTYNWRPVAGTRTLSVHSFGAAIDMNMRFADYWRWTNNGTSDKASGYGNRYPMPLVNIFERHGFIWGGRWYHYDTMHSNTAQNSYSLPSNPALEMPAKKFGRSG